MTKKLLNLTKVALLIFSISFLLGSCTKETFIENPVYIDQTFSNVSRDQWTWNPETSRFERSFNININQHMYDDGVINVSLFFWDYNSNSEKQTTLPYTRAWIENGTNITYTETIGYEISLVSRTITFWIQTSDLYESNDSKDDYEFKLSIITD